MDCIVDHDIYYEVSQNMIKYIMKGQLSDVENALLNDVIKTDDSTYTDYALLRLAILEKQISISRYLINFGFRVNSEINFLFDTPLHEAIKIKNVEIIEMLMDRRASLRALNKDEKTPLQLAAELQDHKIIKLLLNNTYDSYFDELQKYHQWTSLHIACAKNDKERVTSLLEYTTTELNKVIGSTSPVWQGYTPLHIAVTCQYESIIEILLKSDIDLCIPDANGMTSLHMADEFGLHNIERMMLESRRMRFDVNPRNKKGLTHFHIACMIVGNNQNVMKRFITIGRVDINAKLNAKKIGYGGFTPLHICIQNSFSVGAAILMRNRADLSIKNSNGQTPFEMAHENNGEKMFKLFLDDTRIYKIVVQKKAGFYKYRDDTYQNRYFDVVNSLLARGADLNITNPIHRDFAGYTTLHYAVANSNIEFVQSVLKDPRTNINAKNKSKKTPLHIAVRTSRKDIVKMLLSNGASFFEKDAKNKTPIQLAIEQQDGSIVRIWLAALKSYFRVTQAEEEIWNYYQAAYDAKTYDLLYVIWSFPAAVPDNSNAEFGLNDPPSLLKSIALHLAVYKGDNEMVKKLLLDGVYVDVRNLCGATPAHTCVVGEKRSPITLAMLIDAGANVNAQTYIARESPLHLALTPHNYDVMELLVNSGANLRLQNQMGSSALHMIFGHKKHFDGIIEKVKESLGSGAPVDILDQCGQTPLYYAVINNCAWYVELLLFFKANPNRQNIMMQTPLHIACNSADLDVIQLLLKAGASVTLTDREGNLPLHKVVKNKCWKKWQENDNTFFNRILMLYMKIFHELLVAGKRDIDIDAKNGADCSALKLAWLENNHECAQALTYFGANFEPLRSRQSWLCPCPIELSEQHQIQLNMLGLRPCVGEQDSGFYHMSSSVWNLEYGKRCLVELNKMTSDFSFNKYVSLRNIISSSPNDIARYSLHGNLEKCMDDMTFFMNYPIFGPLILARLLYGRRIPMEVIECAKYVLSNISFELTKNGLPDVCTDAILRKLTEVDLYNLSDSMIERVIEENERLF